ncbi:hypothetical protein QC761_507400 [Podospora bellae-mahoneyi]|uniref:Uncharacterized protein n=1 Tax=Podospora bellae-mahoneyi TaxID=2093777 RepID=A0ABR0FDY7_9PEZI|nr:hypothetical protein QC761_507400 [Podospora bellae-mahoneyi]
MTVFNNTSPTPLTFTQVFVLEFFVPGSTSILAAIELVLATDGYFRPLLLCMLLAFLSTHVRRYVWGSIFNTPVNCTIWLVSGLPQPFAHRARSSLYYSPGNGTFYFMSARPRYML